MLHSLAAVQRKKSIKKFDEQFETILHLWNAENIKLWVWRAKKKKKKKKSNFGSRFKLACFLLDVLSHISYNGWYYCYCNSNDKYLMYGVPNIFDEFEKNIYIYDHIPITTS